MAMETIPRGRFSRRHETGRVDYTGRGGVTKKWTWDRRYDEPQSNGAFRLEPYTREDRLFDELGQLPDQETVRTLVALLRTRELRNLAEGILNDCTQASRNRDILVVSQPRNSSYSGWGLD